MFIPPKNIPHNNMVASFRGSPASAGASDYPEFYFFGYPERSSQEPLSHKSSYSSSADFFNEFRLLANWSTELAAINLPITSTIQLFISVFNRCWFPHAFVVLADTISNANLKTTSMTGYTQKNERQYLTLVAVICLSWDLIHRERICTKILRNHKLKSK